jgi:hypothetical protein
MPVLPSGACKRGDFEDFPGGSKKAVHWDCGRLWQAAADRRVCAIVSDQYV